MLHELIEIHGGRFSARVRATVPASAETSWGERESTGASGASGVRQNRPRADGVTTGTSAAVSSTAMSAGVEVVAGAGATLGFDVVVVPPSSDGALPHPASRHSGITSGLRRVGSTLHSDAIARFAVPRTRRTLAPRDPEPPRRLEAGGVEHVPGNARRLRPAAPLAPGLRELLDRATPPIPGYTLILPVPADLPVFARLAIANTLAQDPDGRVETIVVPDARSAEIHRVAGAAAAEFGSEKVRVVESPRPGGASRSGRRRARTTTTGCSSPPAPRR